MVRRVSAQQARDNFGELLDSVHHTNEAVLVEKRSKPYALIVSLADYQELQAKAAAHDWETIEALRDRNDDVDENKLAEDLARELRALRAERRSRTQS